MRRAALVAAAVALVACGVPTEDTAQIEDDADVPFGLLEEVTTPPATGVAPTGSPVRMCLLRDDQLAPVLRTGRPDATLTDVIGLLTGGPTPDEIAEGTTTALTDDAVATGIEAAQGLATVDLTSAFAANVGPRQVLAVAQVVCTLTSQPGIGQVTFTLEGDPVDVPRGDGSTTSRPVSLDDYGRLGDSPTPP